MQSEARLRAYQDAMRRTLAGMTERDMPTPVDAEGYRMMASHERLITWLLDGEASVDRLVSSTIKRAADLPPV